MLTGEHKAIKFVTLVDHAAVVMQLFKVYQKKIYRFVNLAAQGKFMPL